MANLNRVLLIGNLTRDPEIRYTSKGTAIAEIDLAINRVYHNDDGEKREDTTFVNVVLWGRLGELAEQYLKKGSPIFIEGRLQLDTWDDKQTGQKRSRLRVIAENLQSLGARGEGKANSSGTQRQGPRPQRQNPKDQPARTNSAPAGPSKPPHDPDLDTEPDDIPF
jgi:single-strand DNA-binding protein